MEHNDYLVSLFDEQGNKKGTKPRKDIDKEKDIFRTVLLFAQNRKREVWVTKIPEDSASPWKGKFSTSAATIVRENENSATAAARALREELGVTGKHTLVGYPERFYTIGTIKKFITCFIYNTNNTAEDIKPDGKRTGEGQWMPATKVRDMLQNEQEKFSPLFYIAWKQCVGQM